ncbi:CU044_5270 family protein [Cryptosporangium arvum]|uniref:CU044_5270 family protein n=1 Tax=Cryptosporangium arvum DSM 44712 TaxID=927661 RepID=A0A010YQ62_9ACTN|nr:CU044_5270 family protein [Cryptosporangium arvum]EXG82320.1 hypothetical protein CryarDRAFT_3490 [Cryptosporangium arvum DSM 44712]
MDERDDLATLLRTRPPRPLPQADRQRIALMDEMRATRSAARARRWTVGRLRVPAPMLAAGALAATLAVAAAGTTVIGLNNEESVAPGTGDGTTLSAATLADLLRRVDAAADRQPPTVVGATQFLYVRSLDNNNFQPGDPPQNKQEWHSADGTRYGVLDGKATSVDVYESGEQPPAGTPALDAAVLYPDPSRLSGLTNVEPAALLAAINRLSAPGAPAAERAFDRVQTMLDTGGLAFPRVRALLYHVAALIPGVRYDPDGADLLGRRGAVLSLRIDRSSFDLVVDPDTGELLGRRGTAYERYAVVDRIGERPEGAPVGTTPPERPGDRTVRGLDYADETFVVPVDEHFGTASNSDASSLPTLAFQGGVATRRDAEGRTLRYEMVSGRPVAFANLLGRVEGPVLLLRVHTAGLPDAQTAWAVLFLDFSHAEGGPTKLVTWIDPGPDAVSVEASGTTVTVTPAGGVRQRYHWDGDRFTRKN